MAFYSFLRKSNLVIHSDALISTKVLLRSDPHFDRSFGYVTFARLLVLRAVFFLPLPRVPGTLLCMVTALLNHLRLKKDPSGAPLFSVRSTRHVRPVLLHFSSFLSFGATFAFETSVPSEVIKVQRDWCSDCYLK